MKSVSAIVLTKNSERTIEACINAVSPAVDHVVVVDTGSTDNTVQIAKAAGANVFHFEWKDDFAAARNFGDSCAVTDWVIHVDSDEILQPECAPLIHNAIEKYKRERVLISCQQMNITDGIVTPHAIARFYRNQSGFRWKNRIHEKVVSDKPFGSVSEPIRFFHDGYDGKNKTAKPQRNIAILQQGLQEEPDNTDYLFYLGREYLYIPDPKSAVPYLQKAIDLHCMHYEFAHTLLFHALLGSGQKPEAYELARNMKDKFPTYPDALFCYALSLKNMAFDNFTESLEVFQDAKFMSQDYQGRELRDMNIAGWISDTQIADILYFSGDWMNAMSFYKQANTPYALNRIAEIQNKVAHIMSAHG